MNVNQITSSAITPLFKMKMEYKIQSPAGDTIIKLYHAANNETFKIPLINSISGIVVDPNNWVINGNGSIINDILNNKAINFMLFPNPCDENLEIYLPDAKNEKYTISIFDICGKEILSEKILMNDKNKINIDFLQKGIYFIEIKNAIKKSIQKFIKN
jgi:hypothetical protein